MQLELAVCRTYRVSLGNTLISGPIRWLNIGYERAPLQSRSRGAFYCIFAFFIGANAAKSALARAFISRKACMRRMQLSHTCFLCCRNFKWGPADRLNYSSWVVYTHTLYCCAGRAQRCAHRKRDDLVCSSSLHHVKSRVESAVKVAFNSLTCGGALIARGLGAHHPLIAFLKMQMPHY
jgi:hypothetical protein